MYPRPRRRTGPGRLLSAGVTVTLVASTLAAWPAAPASAAPKPACPTSRPDRMSATISARLCGGKVRVDGAETETTEVYALPDGSMQATTAMAPVRVKRADGTWTPVDLTLIPAADATVTPLSGTFGLKLAGLAAGSGEHGLLSIGAGADAVALNWTGALPTPDHPGPDDQPGVHDVRHIREAGFVDRLLG